MFLDYKVIERGQMYIRYLREFVVEIWGMKIENVELMRYFIDKIEFLCKMILMDCCIQLVIFIEEVEIVVLLEDYVNYFEVYKKIFFDIVLKY